MTQLKQRGLNQMIIKVPFDGFYNSYHTANIDDCVNSDIDELPEEHQQIIRDNFSYTDELFTDYSKLFIESVKKDLKDNHGLEISLTFESLDSPREYNFSTDRIFAEISEAAILNLYNTVDKEELAKLVKRRFTSYDGFISHYPNSLSVWNSNPLKWDYNQLSLLIELLLSEDFELYSMDDANCNGCIMNIVYQGHDEESLKLINDFFS